MVFCCHMNKILIFIGIDTCECLVTKDSSWLSYNVQFHVCENLIGLSLWISHIFIYGTVMYSVYDYFISYMYNIYSVFRFFDQF